MSEQCRRVCHVVASMEMGGMERVVHDLLGAAAENGKPDFLFCTDGEGELYQLASAADRACGFRRRLPTIVDFKVVKKLVSFARRNSIELLHAHNHVAHLYAVAASLVLRLPVVVTYHGVGNADNRRTILVKRILARRTAAIVAVSDDARSVLVTRGILKKTKGVTIKNGVDMDRCHPLDASARAEARKKNDIAGNALVIGSVGRFAPEKNYPLLVRAFARFCAEKPSPPVSQRSAPPMLLLVGDGPEMKRIRETVAEYHVEGLVRLPGMQEDIRPFMGCMDIMCLSSITEGSSITLLEAGACGLPAVVTDVGGNSEIVSDRISGLVVQPNDIEALIKAFHELSENVDLRRSMGVAARGRIEQHYSIDSMVRQYADVYREALS